MENENDTGQGNALRFYLPRRISRPLKVTEVVFENGPTALVSTTSRTLCRLSASPGLY